MSYVLNKNALIKEVSRDTYYPEVSTKYIFDTIIEVIERHLRNGDSVSINDFGTFSVKKRAARTGRSFSTGEAIKIPEKTTACWKPSDKLKDIKLELSETE